jgi:hypothetical protein
MVRGVFALHRVQVRRRTRGNYLSTFWETNVEHRRSNISEIGDEDEGRSGLTATDCDGNHGQPRSNEIKEGAQFNNGGSS